MALSSDLISQFVKITNDNEKQNTETIVYGTTKKYGDTMYVRLDGSDLLTPIETTADMKEDERVTVMIKNHTATVTGNLSSPSARIETVKEIDEKVTKLNEVVADKVSTKELEAERARIEKLEANDVVITGKITAAEGDIKNLKVDKLDVTTANATYATIKNLNATNAEIETLKTEKLSAEDAAIKYATIDFANINNAAVQKIFSDSGIIKDLIVSEGHITGELVGVTIKGDLIEGNTIVADKLVVKGENGLYYKLNTDGVTTEAEQTDYNSLNGTVIRAKSVTAEKISVDDLVAFDATIGGFNITDSALYSGVKSSIDNTTRGIYLDKNGQIVFGDSNNYLKYYRSSDGTYKLEIVAGTIKMGTSNKTIEETVTEMQAETENLKETLANEVNTLKDEISTLLRIESSRGTVFKNNAVSTVLSAVIYRGSKRITDIGTLKEVMGSGAYLQWKWQRLSEDTFGIISSDDSRIKDGGFTFILNPDDVDTKVTFICELIVD